jgi:hypothetical protein
MDEDEEEEITRCLCAQQDYPGLPPSRREALLLGRSAVKPEGEQPPPDSSDLLSDEIGSMFIQCDSCKVWQHGGCVGIMDEETSPDEYFCEECRKDLHTIRGEPNGYVCKPVLPSFFLSVSCSSSLPPPIRFRCVATARTGSDWCEQSKLQILVAQAQLRIECRLEGIERVLPAIILPILLSKRHHANDLAASARPPTSPSIRNHHPRPPCPPPDPLPPLPTRAHPGVPGTRNLA